MHRRSGPLVGLAWLAATTVALSADGAIVAHVGSEGISAARLAQELSALPDFQRRALADSPEQLKRTVLEQMIVPETLYALEAERSGLREQPATRDRIRGALADALEQALRTDQRKSAPITAQDVADYYGANKGRFSTPKRIRVFRILVDDQPLASKIISESAGTDGLQHWRAFARDSSLDKATNLRDGDLGFVRPDGTTDAPTVRVDPEVYVAADALADGALIKEPLREGGHWAVLWRRGSLPALERSLQESQPAIVQLLERQRLLSAREALLSSLRAHYVSALNESLLETVSWAPPSAAGRPHAPLNQHPALAGSSQPTEHGSR